MYAMDGGVGVVLKWMDDEHDWAALEVPCLLTPCFVSSWQIPFV